MGEGLQGKSTQTLNLNVSTELAVGCASLGGMVGGRSKLELGIDLAQPGRVDVYLSCELLSF